MESQQQADYKVKSKFLSQFTNKQILKIENPDTFEHNWVFGNNVLTDEFVDELMKVENKIDEKLNLNLIKNYKIYELQVEMNIPMVNPKIEINAAVYTPFIYDGKYIYVQSLINEQVLFQRTKLTLEFVEINPQIFEETISNNLD